MLSPAINPADVTRAIQDSLAPVFLLAGIAAILNVMASRLGRIIDRGRELAEHALPDEVMPPEMVQVELENLERRRHLASAAITACTLSALLVCVVIATLFVELLAQVTLTWLVSLLFLGSTLALVVGLAYFLREVQFAVHTVRIPLWAYRGK
jgi:hypothetical protein